MAPAAPEAEGLLTIAAVFPTIGRYAVSGQQSLRGARLVLEGGDARPAAADAGTRPIASQLRAIRDNLAAALADA